MDQKLVIVIPFYKLRFFEEVLAGFAAQSDKNFTLFIGDDASPENPTPLIEEYRGRLSISYHRFPENLGGTSLVKHWDRCIRMTSAEWIWLFSDDDVVSAECVAGFYQTLKDTSTAFDVYRFNTETINAIGEIINPLPDHPATESGGDFALDKIKGLRNSCAVEYIFRRNAFEANAGFVDFPVAWFSDDASWIAFARKTGFCTITTGKVFWRQSGLNLSSASSIHLSAKLAAFRQYLLWLRREFPDPAFMSRYIAAMQPRFINQLVYWGGRPGLISGLKFWWFFKRFTGRTNFDLLRYVLGLYGLRHILKPKSLRSQSS